MKRWKRAGLATMTALLMSACGHNDDPSSTATAPQPDYGMTLSRMDTDPIVVDGCPVTAWTIHFSPHGNQDYSPFTDRMYIAQCARTTLTTSETCGKACHRSDVTVLPESPVPVTPATPSATAQVMLDALNRLPPEQRAQVLMDVMQHVQMSPAASGNEHPDTLPAP